ncbi:MAG: D-aminoacyl-tRNA deacylase [Patescibacteria group bacterium]|nr:D-aminoacyl-tRNA deacylase [Patescibacteria group bacterium]MDD4466398.1 D-aminoacyl-tRNA deacylase [Patescibacteria group bacterium]
MRAVIQVVSQARVEVGNQVVGQIKRGVLIFLAICKNDDSSQAVWLAKKISQLRIFPDQDGKINFDLAAVAGEALVISQFTLYGKTNRGQRPNFSEAAPASQAVPLYEKFISTLRELGFKVATGHFGALMKVSLVNEGPLTLIIDSNNE